MAQIPSNLEYSYCIRHRDHGGECKIPHNIIASGGGGCLGFKQDPKGCIRHKTVWLKFPLYFDLPTVGLWCDDFMVGGLDSSIRINRIRNVKWETQKGRLMILSDIDFYVNEFSKQFKEKESKPVLKMVVNNDKQ